MSETTLRASNRPAADRTSILWKINTEEFSVSKGSKRKPKLDQRI